MEAVKAVNVFHMSSVNMTLHLWDLILLRRKY